MFEGPAGIVFPGLTKPIDPRDSRSVKMYPVEFEKPETETKKHTKRRRPDHILDLGYTGSRQDGRKKGPPPPLDDCMYIVPYNVCWNITKSEDCLSLAVFILLNACFIRADIEYHDIDVYSNM